MREFSQYFKVQELVSPAIYKKWGETARWFVRAELMELLDFIRERHGPAIINDWAWGGAYTQSGFREPNTKVGGGLSQHRFGAAADLKFTQKSVQEVYQDILDNKELYYSKGLRCIENIKFTTSGNKYGGWLHIDLRDTGLIDDLLIVNP